MSTVLERGARRVAALAGLGVIAALGAPQPADATCCYTLRLGRTVPQPLWVGIDAPLLGSPVTLLPSIPSSGEAEWEMFPADTEGVRAYHFRNTRSLKCMDIKGPSQNNGTPVHQWNCHSGDSQAWKLIRPPIGRGIGYQVINVYANKCLDVTGFRNRPDTLLQIWSCSEAWNQDFVLNRVTP
jgi:hypothetical protein